MCVWCVCVCVCVCVCARAYACVSLCERLVFMCIFARACMQLVCVHACVCARARIHVSLCVYVCVCPVRRSVPVTVY